MDHQWCLPMLISRALISKNEYRNTHVKRSHSRANCTIVCGVTIGAYAFVGAGSVITRDVWITR